MAVISISITESSEQIVSGIPRSISISVNILSTIFYTLDGTIPTLFSTIYTAPIQLPTSKPMVEIKVFATNGVDSSPIVDVVYQTNSLGQDARTPHSGTDAQPNSTQTSQNLAPFGGPGIQPGQQFLGAGSAGLNVYDPSLPAGTPSGFDANGNPTGFTNNQSTGFPTKTFPLQLTDKDFEGFMGPGIGTLPKNTIIPPTAPPSQSDINSPLFDPRALVIIQDLTKPVDPGLPPHINRMFFTLEDVEHTRQGNQYFNVGPDAPPVSGSFLRQHFNPADNTMTYYYFDSTQNRWIISKTPYVPKPAIQDYSEGMVFRRNGGAGMVFQWIPFKGQYLY